jgi:hypothetical protein
VNSYIFARIFRYSTTYIDLKNILEFKEFKDLKLRKLMNLTFLELPKKIPSRYKMMCNCCFPCQTFRENRNLRRCCEFKYLCANL